MSIFSFSTKLIAIVILCVPGYVMANNFATPEEAVKTYIKAVKTGSGEHIKSAFSESASIQYYDDQGKFNDFTRDAFAKLVNTGNKWNATIEITDMKKTKKAANATVEFTWGENGERGYVDYLNLIHSDQGWQITDKVAQYVDR